MVPDRTRAASARSTSRCAGGPATTRSCGASSTSSQRRRAERHQPGFDQGLLQVPAPAGRAERTAAQSRHRQAREGRRARRTHRGADGAPARAAVRRPDQRGPRHAGGARHRRRRSSRKALAANGSPRTKRDDKAQSALLLDKVVAEMKSRISARAHKETQRRKNALESSSLPAKLVDCRSQRRRQQRAVHRRGRFGARHRSASHVTASTRRCFRSAARSSTCRRRRSPTCSATPSAHRSSR